MKTYLLTFKSNNPKSNETIIFAAKGVKKEIIAEAGQRDFIFGYHFLKTSIIISACDISMCSFPKLPGFES